MTNEIHEIYKKINKYVNKVLTEFLSSMDFLLLV